MAGLIRSQFPFPHSVRLRQLARVQLRAWTKNNNNATQTPYPLEVDRSWLLGFETSEIRLLQDDRGSHHHNYR